MNELINTSEWNGKRKRRSWMRGLNIAAAILAVAGAGLAQAQTPNVVMLRWLSAEAALASWRNRLTSRRREQTGREDLQRHLAIEPAVDGTINPPHGALSSFGQNAVGT